MAHMEGDKVLNAIRAHAYESLDAERRLTTNLSVDLRVHEAGDRLGPDFQNITTERASVVVFADDDPRANFGHPCRYLLYNPETAELFGEVAARFPPYLTRPPETLRVFHEPIRMRPNPDVFRIRPILPCPILVPDGERYAILYSGMSNMRHLNDLEFCYRMLIDRYGFDASHIYVLNYDCSLNTQDGLASTWPGDGTAYRIQVTGPGNRSGFQSAIGTLRGMLKPHDQLFIHTNNHGDNDGSESFLCEYPNWGQYMASDFCTDLASLPSFRSLLVMMEQCNSGGFNVPVLAASTADSTSIASAAIATQSSYGSADGHWDCFARDWIAAQIGHDPYGAALAFNPDTNTDGIIQAEEAFNYANAVKYSGDSPNYGESSEAGGDIALGQQYDLWWWWCRLVLPPLAERYRVVPPDPEFYRTVRRLTPELREIVVPVLDRAARELEAELAPRVENAINAAFASELTKQPA